jgi:hypothetical protein
VPSTKVALVKIDFVAEKTVDDVQFELMLPDGLRFSLAGGRSWPSALFAGMGGSRVAPILCRLPSRVRARDATVWWPTQWETAST